MTPTPIHRSLVISVVEQYADPVYGRLFEVGVRICGELRWCKVAQTDSQVSAYIAKVVEEHTDSWAISGGERVDIIYDTQIIGW